MNNKMIKDWNELDLSEELYNTPSEKDKKQSKETGYFSTLTFQVILCLIIAIILVLLNTFFPSQYHDIDQEMKKQIQEDGGFTEDMNRLKGQFEIWLNKDKPTVLPNVTPQSELEDTNSTEEILSGVTSENVLSETESQVESSEVESSEAESSKADTSKATSSQVAAGGPPTEETEIPTNVSLKKYSFDKAITSPLKTLSVTSVFGKRTHPITKETDFHNGVDLAGNEGDEIRVILSGTVVEAEESKGFGKHLRVRHADGNESFYAHCSELLVKKGDQVKKGQVIAKVGSTGMSTGPHLHFGYLIDSKYVNPKPVLDCA